MNLIVETRDLSAFLAETSIINYRAPCIQQKIADISASTASDKEQAKMAFEFVRDDVAHSFDLDSELITITASEALDAKEGICFAKAHLLAAMLRGLGIPTGFCYQRVTRRGTPESGFALHGLNAVYLPSHKVWFRLDPRGNKKGIDSRFSVDSEQLAYTLRPEIGEVDYPYVFANPLPEVIASMKNSVNCHELFVRRPETLQNEGIEKLLH